MEHSNDYVERVKGGLSKKGSDQVTEAAHQLLKNRMRTSKYWVKRVGSEEEGDGLRKAVVHLSAALKIMFLLPTPQKCDPSFLALK